MEIHYLTLLNKAAAKGIVAPGGVPGSTVVPPPGSQCVVALLDHFTHGGHLCLVFEFFPATLLDAVTRTGFRGLPLGEVRGLVRQLVSSLHFLHARQLCHADVKLENVMLTAPTERACSSPAAPGSASTLEDQAAHRSAVGFGASPRSGSSASLFSHSSVTSSSGGGFGDGSQGGQPSPVSALLGSPGGEQYPGCFGSGTPLAPPTAGQQRNAFACPSSSAGVGIKLIDFGSSSYEGTLSFHYVQSRFYRAPEVMLGLPYDSSIDLWSVACVAAELFLGLPLFPGCSEHDLLLRVTRLLGPLPEWMLEAGHLSGRFFTARERGRGGAGARAGGGDSAASRDAYTDGHVSTHPGSHASGAQQPAEAAAGDVSSGIAGMSLLASNTPRSARQGELDSGAPLGWGPVARGGPHAPQLRHRGFSGDVSTLPRYKGRAVGAALGLPGSAACSAPSSGPSSLGSARYRAPAPPPLEVTAASGDATDVVATASLVSFLLAGDTVTPLVRSRSDGVIDYIVSNGGDDAPATHGDGASVTSSHHPTPTAGGVPRVIVPPAPMPLSASFSLSSPSAIGSPHYGGSASALSALREEARSAVYELQSSTPMPAPRRLCQTSAYRLKTCAEFTAGVAAAVAAGVGGPGANAAALAAAQTPGKQYYPSNSLAALVLQHDQRGGLLNSLLEKPPAPAGDDSLEEELLRQDREAIARQTAAAAAAATAAVMRDDGAGWGAGATPAAPQPAGPGVSSAELRERRVFVDFLLRMLSLDPRHRMTAAQALAHPFLLADSVVSVALAPPSSPSLASASGAGSDFIFLSQFSMLLREDLEVRERRAATLAPGQHRSHAHHHMVGSHHHHHHLSPHLGAIPAPHTGRPYYGNHTSLSGQPLHSAAPAGHFAGGHNGWGAGAGFVQAPSAMLRGLGSPGAVPLIAPALSTHGAHAGALHLSTGAQPYSGPANTFAFTTPQLVPLANPRQLWQAAYGGPAPGWAPPPELDLSPPALSLAQAGAATAQQQAEEPFGAYPGPDAYAHAPAYGTAGVYSGGYHAYSGASDGMAGGQGRRARAMTVDRAGGYHASVPRHLRAESVSYQPMQAPYQQPALRSPLSRTGSFGNTGTGAPMQPRLSSGAPAFSPADLSQQGGMPGALVGPLVAPLPLSGLAHSGYGGSGTVPMPPVGDSPFGYASAPGSAATYAQQQQQLSQQPYYRDRQMSRESARGSHPYSSSGGPYGLDVTGGSAPLSPGSGGRWRSHSGTYSAAGTTMTAINGSVGGGPPLSVRSSPLVSPRNGASLAPAGATNFSVLSSATASPVVGPVGGGGYAAYGPPLSPVVDAMSPPRPTGVTGLPLMHLEEPPQSPQGSFGGAYSTGTLDSARRPMRSWPRGAAPAIERSTSFGSPLHASPFQQAQEQQFQQQQFQQGSPRPAYSSGSLSDSPRAPWPPMTLQQQPYPPQPAQVDFLGPPEVTSQPQPQHYFAASGGYDPLRVNASTSAPLSPSRQRFAHLSVSQIMQQQQQQQQQYQQQHGAVFQAHHQQPSLAMAQPGSQRPLPASPALRFALPPVASTGPADYSPRFGALPAPPYDGFTAAGSVVPGLDGISGPAGPDAGSGARYRSRTFSNVSARSAASLHTPPPQLAYAALSAGPGSAPVSASPRAPAYGAPQGSIVPPVAYDPIFVAPGGLRSPGRGYPSDAGFGSLRSRSGTLDGQAPSAVDGSLAPGLTSPRSQHLPRPPISRNGSGFNLASLQEEDR